MTGQNSQTYGRKIIFLLKFAKLIGREHIWVYSIEIDGHIVCGGMGGEGPELKTIKCRNEMG